MKLRKSKFLAFIRANTPTIASKTHRTKKSILVQYGVGEDHERMLSLVHQHHQQYAKHWGADYYVEPPRSHHDRAPHWYRIDLILRMLKKKYDQVVWLDTDCVIVDTTISLFDISGFGIACCECFDSPTIERHLNTGFLVVNKCPDTLKFLRMWRQRPLEGVYEDQSSFIKLMETRPQRDLLTILPNRFNCVDQHMEARHPVIRAFHGDPERVRKIESLLTSL